MNCLFHLRSARRRTISDIFSIRPLRVVSMTPHFGITATSNQTIITSHLLQLTYAEECWCIQPVFEVFLFQQCKFLRYLVAERS